MDKYEYRIRAEEINSLIERKEYVEAVKIADTIDWRRVRSVVMLCKVSELYKMNRRYEDSKEVLLLAYDLQPNSRKIVYSLCELSIKLEETVQAVEYYKEFTQIAPRDTGRFILQYRLYEAQDVSLEERIAVLEEYKKRDYREKWAYELAYLYHRIGLATRCVEECDELVLWFGEGRYVIKALELKMLHAPLTPSQQEKYNARFMVPAEEAAATETADSAQPEENVGAEDVDPILQGVVPVAGAETLEMPGQEAVIAAGSESSGIYPQEEMISRENLSQEDFPEEVIPQEGVSEDALPEESVSQEAPEDEDADMKIVNPAEDLDIQVKTIDVGDAYNTINLQEELAKNLAEILAQEDMEALDATRALPVDSIFQATSQGVSLGETKEIPKVDEVSAREAEAATVAAEEPNEIVEELNAVAVAEEPEIKESVAAVKEVTEISAPEPESAAEESAEVKEVAEIEAVEKAEEVEAGEAENVTVEPEASVETEPAETPVVTAKMPITAEQLKAEILSTSLEDVKVEEPAEVPVSEELQEIKENREVAEVPELAAETAETAEIPETAAEPEAQVEISAETPADISAEIPAVVPVVTAKIPVTAEQLKAEILSTSLEDVKVEEPAEVTEEIKPEEPVEATEEVKPEEPVEATEEIEAEEPAEVTEEIKPEEPAEVTEETKPEELSVAVEEAAEVEKKEETAEEVKEEVSDSEESEEIEETEELEEINETEEPAEIEEPVEAVKEDIKEEKSPVAMEIEPLLFGKNEPLPEALIQAVQNVAMEAAKEAAKQAAHATVEAMKEIQPEVPASNKEEVSGDEQSQDKPEEAAAPQEKEPEPQVEKQITGQLSFTDIMAEWEETKKANEEKHLQEIKQRVMEQTGPLFSNFDATAKAESSLDMLSPMLDVFSDTEGLATEVENALAEDISPKETVVSEIPAAEAAPAVYETPVAEEASAVYEKPVAGETLVAAEIPAAEAAPAAYEAPMAEAVSAVYETLVVETTPAVPEVPAAEVASLAYETPVMEEIPAVTETPVMETAPVAGDILEDRPSSFNTEEINGLEDKLMDALGNQHYETSNISVPIPVVKEEIVPRGLTKEEKELFGSIAQTKEIQEKVAYALDSISLVPTSGNVIVTGEKGTGALEVAQNIAAYLSKTKSGFTGNSMTYTGKELAETSIITVINEVVNGALIVDNAGDMSANLCGKLLKAANDLIDKGIVFIFVDTKSDMERLTRAYQKMTESFDVHIDITTLDNNGLVNFGKEYAKEKEYSIDDMGVLALYNRIEERQTNEHAVTIDEVKDIVNEAIIKAEKKNLTHFMDVIFAKRYDKDDMVVLREKDFMNE